MERLKKDRCLRDSRPKWNMAPWLIAWGPMCLALTLLASVAAYAQPPGTTPTPEIIRGEASGIAPDAFLFLDESGTPVVMPRMSFEEIDRLRRLEQGIQVQDRRATLQRIDLTGGVEKQRAELELECHFVIDPRTPREGTSSPIVLDLGLHGFHLLEPAIVEAVTDDPREDSTQEKSDDETDASAKSLESESDRLNGQLARAFVRVSANKLSTRDESLDSSAASSTSSNTNGSTRNGGLGYELVLPAESAASDAPIDCVCRMRMSTRVRRLGPRTSFLPLSLPDVPTRLEVAIVPPTINDSGSGDSGSGDSDAPRPLISAEVVGNGREVLRQLSNRPTLNEGKPAETASSRFEIDSQGGEFAFKWQWLPSATQAARLLETESEAIVRWESPADPPTMQVQLVVRNLRGQLDQFAVELPERAVLLGSPEVAIDEVSRENTLAPEPSASEDATTAAFESGEAIDVADSGWTMKLLSEAENEASNSTESSSQRIQFSTDRTDAMTSTSRVEVRLQLRLPVPEASATSPWAMNLPRVPDAIGHRGTVTVVTAEDHRLRWRPRLGVEAIASDAATVNVGERTQSFRFLRDSFQLPVWLSGKQRQQRLSVAIDLAVSDRLARSVMTVQSSGSGIDPQDMQLDLTGWQLTHLTADDDEEELDISISDGLVQWQADASDGKWPREYVITTEKILQEPGAEPSITEDSQILALTLPRLQTNESSSAITEAIIKVADAKRLQWTVDLSQSDNLQRTGTETQNQFRLLSVDGPWTVVGNFSQQPLKLSLSGGTSMGTQGSQWITHSSWNLASTIDLEGILSFVVPTSASNGAQWSAVVNGVPAMVRRRDTDQANEDWSTFEIVTPRLSTGDHEVELTSRLPLQNWLPTSTSDTANQLVNRNSETDPNSPAAASASDESPTSPLPADQHSSHLAWMGIPQPIADQIALESDYRLSIPQNITGGKGKSWSISISDGRQLPEAQKLSPNANGRLAANLNEWSFTSIPDAPFSLEFAEETVETTAVRVSRALIRSLVGQRTRHEQLIAVIEDGQQIGIGLSSQLKTIRIETRLNGNLVPTSRTRGGLKVDIPSRSATLASSTNTSATPNPGSTRSLLDVRIWTETETSPWWTTIQPLMRLPVGSAQIDWQLSVPTDSHLFWASSSAGRMMQWQRDQLRLSREPILDDSELVEWVTTPFESNQTTLALLKEASSNASFTVPSNQYLFYSSDPYAFSALTISRTMMWLAVGSISLLLAASTQLFPRSRHPFAIILLAVVLAGVLVAAPDGVIVTAQLIMISLVLVIVFYAISALISPTTSDRVLQSSNASRGSAQLPPYGSTRANRRNQGSLPGSRSAAKGSQSRPTSTGSTRRRQRSGVSIDEDMESPDSVPGDDLREDYDEEGATASHSPGSSS